MYPAISNASRNEKWVKCSKASFVKFSKTSKVVFDFIRAYCKAIYDVLF